MGGVECPMSERINGYFEKEKLRALFVSPGVEDHR